MSEMPPASEYHRDDMFIASSDHFVVPLGTAGLNDGRNAGLRRAFNRIWKGEERIRGKDGASRTAGGLLQRNLNRIDAAHLARSGTAK
jgi:hypothetical protein